jgi:hypothetical protein
MEILVLLLEDLLPFKDSPWHLHRAVGVLCHISAIHLLMLLNHSIRDAQKPGGRGRGPSILE